MTLLLIPDSVVGVILGGCSMDDHKGDMNRPAQTGDPSAGFGGPPAEILLVEDNAGDVLLTTECLQRTPLPTRLHVVRDGVEALRFLRQEGPHSDAPRPALVLLDLNLPKKDGREVLAEVKADENLRQIPVIILTTSTHEQDVASAYDLHANCYITKPLDLDRFVHVMESIESFWLSVVKLPR